jgi:hypothetical protein
MTRPERVQVRCFDCGEVVEAAHVDGVVEAFVVHGRERHEWSIPDLHGSPANGAQAVAHRTMDHHPFPIVDGRLRGREHSP